MANTGKKYIKLASGRLQEQAAFNEGGSEGDLVALDASGRIPDAMMPVGIGADTASIVASENLASGDFVNIWNDSGTIKVRKADATTAGKEADGFVLDAVTAAANATVYFEGRNTSLTSLTLGARYYLSAATAGGVVTTPPSSAGNVVQFLGRAVSATSLSFEATDGVIVA